MPFKGPFSLTGALTGPPYGKAPYGEASYGKAGPLQEAPYEKGRSLREGPGSRTGPSQRRTTKRLTGRPPYGEASYEKAPYELQESLRETWGKTLPEFGGNFRLCAVDQKRPFFPRAGPFLDLLPFKGPFSLTGALTGPPYGKAPYGEACYGKAPLQAPYEEGRSLREGPGSRTGPSQRRTTKRLTGRQGPYGKPLTRRDGPYEKGRSLMEGPGSLTGPSQRRTTKRLTGRQGPYGKPLRPYGQTDLREGLLRVGFLQEGPLREGFLREGP